jgi:single-strand DNA-binding protein
MMSDIMKSIFTGRMARAPELKYTSGGLAIARMAIVCNRSKKVGDEWQDDPSFFELVAFGKTAEHLSDKCTKGQKMTFDCEAKQERWEKNGEKQSRVTFIVQTYVYGEKPRGGAQEGQGDAGYQNRQQNASAGPSGASAGGYDDSVPPDFPDDIPF